MHAKKERAILSVTNDFVVGGEAVQKNKFETG
jgi:hypothetical protein